MARTEITGGEGSMRGRTVRRRREEGGKYARYTEEQIEVLEKVYAECSNPNHVQRAQIMREEPVLKGTDSKQLKVWFQNRRCRERQKKENGDLVSENKWLASSNKLLREENDGLNKKLDQLIRENEHLRSQVLSFTSTVTTLDMARHLEASNPQLPIRIADDNNGLLFLAEETKKEFVSKAVGTAMNWVLVPWLKMHNPSSAGAFYVPSSCPGVAARACATIPFEPTKAIEILKDRRSWSRHCRNMDIVAKHPVDNGGSIELIYTQHYGPTTLACARDFWTLRYTCGLDDGGFMVCERSISSSDAGPSSPVALEFVRGRMLASGYLIRPAEGGSTIYMVDHLDLEASSVPEVIRPLYESSELVAKKMIVSALHYIEHADNEMNGRITRQASSDEPALMRSFSERLSRGFNEAVHCFSEDGWTLMNGDASDDVIVSIKRARQFGFRTNYDTVICVKASVLLQNDFPADLVKYLKEHRTEWMDFDFANHSIAYSEGISFAYPAKHTHKLEGYPVVLAKTMHEDEALEIVKFDGIDRSYLRGLYHLQINNGMEDTGFGACSELIFAPIDINLPEDAVLLPSGFRFILLSSNSDMRFASNGTFSPMNGHAAGSHPPTIMTLAFQFPFEAHLQEEVKAMARQYVRRVISSVRNISARMMSPRSNREMTSQADLLRNISDGPMPVGHYLERYAEANRARLHISGVMPSGPYSQMISTGENLDSMSNRDLFATRPTGANTTSVQNISVGIIPSSLYPVLNSAEANPGSVLNISSGVMPSGSHPRTNSAEANPAIMNYISGGVGPSGSNSEMNFREANAENTSGAVMPSGSYPNVNTFEASPAMDFGSTPQSTFAANLANLIRQSYRSTLGVDMLGFNSHQRTVSVAEMIWHHPYAIMCFSFTSLPACLYANQAAINMLETTVDNLPNLTVDRILDGIHNLSLPSVMPTIMNQGYCILPPGQCLSVNNHFTSYDQAVIWKVHGPDGSIHSFALACINWSFI